MVANLFKGKNKPQTPIPQQKSGKGEISDKKKEAKIKISGRRLWYFRFIAIIVIPAVLILATEIGLRLAGFGYVPKAIIPCKVQGQSAYCDNIKFGWLFFPPNISREFNPFIIPLKKPENTYRIFVFGSSAAMGDPDPAYGFSRILKYLLSEQYPGVNFEVINTAMTAINSHVVVKITEDCAQYQPDLFVVYMGNNEVIGPYGAGTVFAPLSDNLSLIHLGIALRGTRIGQMLTNISYAAGWKKVPKSWSGMGMFLEKQVSTDDPSLQIVYKNFGSNLEAIIKTSQKRKVPVILSTVASNLRDCPPFASLHRKGLTADDVNKFDTLYKQAREIDRQGQYAQAIEKYLEAESIDGQFAELQYCMGRCYYLTDKYDEAKDRFVKARELDTVRLRADSRINKTIKEAAQNRDSEGVYLADSVGALDKQSTHQIPGSDLFYEHVHLNFRGNYFLAVSFFEQIEKILPARIKSRMAAEQQIKDEKNCMQALVYSDWDEYRIAKILLNSYISRPPFTNQIYHYEQVKRLTKVVESIKNKINNQVISQISSDYQSAVEKRPEDWMLHWNYGNFLIDAIQDNRTAIEEFKKVLEIIPQYYLVHCELGNLYGQEGNFDEAFRHFHEAEKIRPYFADIYYGMGVLYQLKSDSFRKMTNTAKPDDYTELLNQAKESLKESEKSYRHALRLDPEHYPSTINLSFVLGSDGRIDEAIQICRSGLEFYPDLVDLHYNLGAFLIQTGQIDEAIKEFNTVLKIDPGYTPAKLMLEKMMKK